MSASFAGSRSVDERRRRRLATECDPSHAGVPHTGSDDADCVDSSQNWPHTPLRKRREVSEDDPTTRFDLPLTEIVPRRVLPMLAAVGLLCLPTFAALFAVEYESNFPGRLGPGFSRLAVVDGMGLVRLCSVALLSFAGMLALLIRWIRSRSLQDFSGQFRNWGWISVTWFLAAAVTASEFHLAWQATVLWSWQPPIFAFDVLSWSLPSFVVLLTTSILVFRETRRCRLSTTLFLLSAGCYLAFWGVCLPLDHSWSGAAEPLLIPGLGAASALFLALSMLLHGRYVLYVSTDPPARCSRRRSEAMSRVKRLRKRSTKPGLLNRLTSRLTFRKTSTSSKKPETPTIVSDPDVKPVTAEAMEPAKPVCAADATSSVEQPADEATPEVDESCDDQQQSTGRILRVDAPIDPSRLRGLSKREQRRLRKEHRQKQRMQSAE